MILHLEKRFTSPTETFITNQIDFLSNYKSIVFTINYLNNLKVNAEVFESPSKTWFSNKFLTKKQVDEFISIYNNQKPSLLHGHFLTDAAYFHPFSKRIDIPKVCSGYGYDVSNFPKRWFGLGKRYFNDLFKEYDAFTAMSNDMADDIIKLGCPKHKVIVHYHGINTLFFNIERVYEDKDVFNILTIASLVPKKGHLTVLRALKLLKQRFPKVSFHYNIVGSGPLLEVIKKYTKENNLDQEVTFFGPVKHGIELLNIIETADIFVHPSMTATNGGKEGIPGAVVEAMASGLPVITTFHAGIPEIITDKKDGLLTNEGNSEEIADFIYQLFTSNALRTYLGTNAKHTALTKLDIRIKNEELTRIYDDLIK